MAVIGRFFAGRSRFDYLGDVLAILVVIVGLHYGSRVAGGSDSYGYVSQADLWLKGDLKVPVPIARQVPWSRAVDTFTPLGYTSFRAGQIIVPTYSPGLPLLMAAAKFLAGHAAVFWIVPLCGGLLIAMTCRIGRAIAPGPIGVIAAWFVATSPPMVSQLLAPMSDVPAAAFWALSTMCVIGETRWRALAGGLSASLAILIRPNLAPIAAVSALWLLWPDIRESMRGRWRTPWRAILYSVAIVPSVAIVAWINNDLYGSPMVSGYGRLSDTFAWANVWKNLTLYLSWFIDNHTVIGLAGVAALALLPWRALWPDERGRRVGLLLAAVAGTTWLEYQFYLPFEHWSYQRFLLPGWPSVFVGLAMVVVALLRQPKTMVRAVGIAMLVVAAAFGPYFISRNDLLGIGWREGDYVRASELVKLSTPASSVIYTMQHSGSLRYYSGRVTLRYDQLPADGLERTVTFFSERGIPVYALLSHWELDQFRARFPSSALGKLDWMPVAIAQGADQIYLFDLGKPGLKGPDPRPVAVSIPRLALPQPADMRLKSR